MIDFRSDTVTHPTKAMRSAMAEALVGDDVYGDDPTVNKLEALAAEMLGFEAAVFTCSGTQANLLALMAHCGRGDEYICGQQAHNYKFEGGGAAVLGSIQPQPIDNNPDGTLDLAKVANAIKVDDIHFAKTRLLSLENTINGKVLPKEYLAQAQALCFDKNLRLHLDGARAFNAAVKSGVPISEITQYFDSVSICLSKGLCAPVGSILVGSEELINSARRWRKVCGGAMRQAGILAAAGILALEQQVDRLAQDHEHALDLANLLAGIDELDVNPDWVQTNMVFAKPVGLDANQLSAYLKTKGILASPGNPMRFVTHAGVDSSSAKTLVNEIKSFVTNS